MDVKFDPILGKLRESDATTVVVGESYTHVATYDDLPAANSVNLNTIDSYRVVDKTTGVIFINQHKAGFYISTGSAWDYIGPNIETSSIKVGAVTVIGAPIELSGTNLTLTPDKITSTINIAAGSMASRNFWTGTIAEYNALGTWDSTTTYNIIG